ncbi:MAG: chemotaxis protein CheX [Magnetococcus sp. YQC-5]
MDNLVKAFLMDLGTTMGEAVQEIAETMLFVEIEPGSIVTDASDLALDYCATIQFSDGIQGVFCLIALQRSALKLASALMGEERLEMDVEMDDAFKEVANMVAGGLVTRVEGRHGSVNMTPPLLMRDGSHPGGSDEQEWLRVHHKFALDGVPFCAELALLRSFVMQKVQA